MMENKTKIDLKNTSIFITGAAGFIGSNLAKRILTTVEGAKVVGLDNMNHYYDVRLKEARLDELNKFENFSFVKGNLADKETITTIFEQYKPQIVVNLGAQAGVRYSITNPDAYVEANLIGFYNILEACRHSYDEGHTPVEHLVYANHDQMVINAKAYTSKAFDILRRSDTDRFWLEDLGILGGFFTFGVMALALYGKLFYASIKKVIDPCSDRMTNYDSCIFVKSIVLYMIVSCVLLNIFDAQRIWGVPFYLSIIFFSENASEKIVTKKSTRHIRIKL